MTVEQVLILMKQNGHPDFEWLEERAKESGFSIEAIASAMFMTALYNYAQEKRVFRHVPIKDQADLVGFYLAKPEDTVPTEPQEATPGMMLAKRV